jgi:hypothetical protein
VKKARIAGDFPVHSDFIVFFPLLSSISPRKVEKRQAKLK